MVQQSFNLMVKGRVQRVESEAGRPSFLPSKQPGLFFHCINRVCPPSPTPVHTTYSHTFSLNLPDPWT